MALGRLLPNLYLSVLDDWSPNSSWSCILKNKLSVIFLGLFNSPSATELLDLRPGDPSTTLYELAALLAVAGIVTGD